MKKVIFLVLVGLIALLPIGVKKYVDGTIATQKTNLKQNGVDLKVLNEEGYLSSKRDFKLTIEDEEKFLSYIGSTSEDVNFLLSLVKDDMDFKEFLKGLNLKGSIKNSNINYFGDIDVNVYLDKLSDKLMKSLEEDKTNPVYVFLEKKLLNFDMKFSNKGKFKKSVLKDINEKFDSNEGDSLDLKITGQELENDPSASNIKGATTLDEFFMNYIEDNDNKVKMGFKDLDYEFEGENNFIADAKFELKNFSIDSDEYFAVDKIEGKSNGKVKDNDYNVNGFFKFLGFKAEGKRGEKVNLKDIELYTEILGLDYASLKSFMDFNKKLQAKLSEVMNEKDEKKRVEYMAEYMALNQKLLDLAKPIINNGLNLKFNTKLDELSLNNQNVKSFKIDLDGKLDKNEFDIKRGNPLTLLSALNVDGKIVIDEKGFETLSALSGGMVGFIASYVKKEGGNVVFDIKFENSQLMVNNKPFQLR